MGSLDVGSRYRIQTLKKATGPKPERAYSWAVADEVRDSLQLLLIATYPTIIRLGSVSNLISQSSSQLIIALSIAGHRYLET